MSKPNHRLTNILIRILSFLFLISLARFSFFLLSLSSSSSVAVRLPDPDHLSLLKTHYSSIFQSLIADGFLSLESKALCIETRADQDVAVSALKHIGVPDSVGVKKTGQTGFKNDTFNLVFASDLDGTPELGKLALEITRMLKWGGFFVVHTLAKDDYSLNSLLCLFKSFMFVRSREINGLDSIREIILIKQKRNLIRNGSLVNKCSSQWHNRNLIRNIEPLIKEEPLKPWVTFKRNLKNITYLPSLVDISFKTGYIYIDIGARSYSSSIGNWFQKKYPKQDKVFQIFAIEPDNVFYNGYLNKKRVTLVPYAAWMRNGTLFYEISLKKRRRFKERNWGMGRPQSAQSSLNFVGDFHKIEGFNFVSWLKGAVLETDFVVVKMDVEGSEFQLIPKLVESGAIYLIDELFVECHYNRWQKCCPGQKSDKYQKTYKECSDMFLSLRNRGVFVHQWWRVGKRFTH